MKAHDFAKACQPGRFVVVTHLTKGQEKGSKGDKKIYGKRVRKVLIQPIQDVNAWNLKRAKKLEALTGEDVALIHKKLDPKKLRVKDVTQVTIQHLEDAKKHLLGVYTNPVTRRENYTQRDMWASLKDEQGNAYSCVRVKIDDPSRIQILAQVLEDRTVKVPGIETLTWYTNSKPETIARDAISNALKNPLQTICIDTLLTWSANGEKQRVSIQEVPQGSTLGDVLGLE